MEKKKMNTRHIAHMGQEMETVYYCNITNQEYQNIVKLMYEKPNFDLVKQQITNIYMCNQTTNNYITDYYFKDLMYDTKVWYNKWSISEIKSI